MIQAYCTAAESQGYLADYPDWMALTDDQQDTQLSWGRVYMDSLYTCAYDETDATDEMKQANALAGYLNFQGTLFEEQAKVTATAVSAGSVSSNKTYQGSYTNKDPMFNQIKALLTTDCVRSSGNGVVTLTRN